MWSPSESLKSCGNRTIVEKDNFSQRTTNEKDSSRKETPNYMPVKKRSRRMSRHPSHEGRASGVTLITSLLCRVISPEGQKALSPLFGEVG